MLLIELELWRWYTASIQNPTHAFPATGTYNVTPTSVRHNVKIQSHIL